MIKVIEIRKIISSSLKQVNPNVYYQQASKDASYPHIVYDLPNSVDDGSMEQFVLDIDGWDDQEDTTNLETIMDAVDKQLHRKSFIANDELSMTVYRDNRLTLIDDDHRLRRIKYTYEIRTFERGI